MENRYRTSQQAQTATIPPFGLRLQAVLKAELEQAARDAGRSMNAEICDRLRQSFEPSAELDPDVIEALQRFASSRGISASVALNSLIHAGLREDGAKVVSLQIAPGVSMKELSAQLADAAAENPEAQVFASGRPTTVGTVIGTMTGGLVRIKQNVRF